MTTSAPEGHDVACGISTPPKYGRCRSGHAPRVARGRHHWVAGGALGDRDATPPKTLPCPPSPTGSDPARPSRQHHPRHLLAHSHRGSCDDEGYGGARWVGGG